MSRLNNQVNNQMLAPPPHDTIVYRRSHRLTIGRYENGAYRPTLSHSKVIKTLRLIK